MKRFTTVWKARIVTNSDSHSTQRCVMQISLSKGVWTLDLPWSIQASTRNTEASTVIYLSNLVTSIRKLRTRLAAQGKQRRHGAPVVGPKLRSLVLVDLKASKSIQTRNCHPLSTICWNENTLIRKICSNPIYVVVRKMITCCLIPTSPCSAISWRLSASKYQYLKKSSASLRKHRRSISSGLMFPSWSHVKPSTKRLKVPYTQDSVIFWCELRCKIQPTSRKSRLWKRRISRIGSWMRSRVKLMARRLFRWN